ncbi:NAD(P)/FAD-dependent oxidoreductase [Microvirga lotononidis]|uniref:NADH:ubiquinone reductase (non-electrogenic) n=1 Tax=Microvirga lotononidis TaxID=864069 RepID=I4YT68_9HYPH|nr:NAD(P)/FAD-dependent oxidoreductase [Microvirga lotononidis]EIM27160.1 NADH dehydrogenase, FAD-containing subunit [Microvirga lotononidis]WQO28655.1 NAD(P)/FAD-dependent oxidoreductase [Microvirga lotononidis]
MTARRPKVVIVGAGFGGLTAAQSLARAPVDVTIIDRHNFHYFQPLLYQVATAALSPADIAWPIRGILRRQKNATVFLADVTGIDAQARMVQAGSLSIPYDYLVLATGATHSYFGHPEWASVAPGLKQIEDATVIRRKILLAFEHAELTDDANEQRRLLTFVVVGGGPTGVEMAGAIAEVAHHALSAEFRRIDPHSARVILIEAGPRLLPAFPEDLAAYAQTSLERMGVEVRTNARVTDCTEAGVDLEETQIAAGTVIWAAGVVASPAAEWLGAEHDRAERIKVEPNLKVPGRSEIFAIGDTASVVDSDGKTVPGIAPAAKQMGRYVARVIAAEVEKKTSPGPFRYRHQGDLATIGRKSAVVKLDSIHLTGFIGWLFWGIAHVYFLIGLRNRAVVAFTWLWNYLTLQRGARLITDGPAEQATARDEKARPLPSSVEVSQGPERNQSRLGRADWR